MTKQRKARQLAKEILATNPVNIHNEKQVLSYIGSKVEEIEFIYYTFYQLKIEMYKKYSKQTLASYNVDLSYKG